MKSKSLNNLFKVYDALDISDRKVYTYDISSSNKCIDSEYYYTFFGEAVSDASVEALEESEIYNTTIFIWIYEISSPNSNLHPLKGFKIKRIA